MSKLFISQIYKSNNDKILNLIKRRINNCGCICIKCIQWIIPILENQNIDPKLFNMLSSVYEDNNVHDIKHMAYLYKKHQWHFIITRYN